MEQFEIIAKTFRGLEGVLAKEIRGLGASEVKESCRMVSFMGDKEMLYRANFCLRTAVRVLKPLLHFEASDPDGVYEAVRTIEWTDHLDAQTSFSVDSVVYSDDFRHSKFVAYKVKDAIADYFREKTGKRPNVSITNPDLRLNIHINEHSCTLSLDSSGDSLHLRGYRTATVEAPLNEVLAAGLILLSGWQGEKNLIDPFCGSGTLLIEAALIARNIYPGVFRKKFGFENWKDFDSELLQAIYEDDSAERECTCRFFGYDINKPALEAAQANAKSAGVAALISFEQRDVHQFEQPAEPAIMITNPPYGERLRTPNILNLYATLGERLKHAFCGGEAWIISSKEELFAQIGLKPSVKFQLFNGKLDCELRKYQIFDGKFSDLRAEGRHIKSEEEKRQMGEKHRVSEHREEFKQRAEQREDYADNDFMEENPNFIALRNRHATFAKLQAGRARREERLQRQREGHGEERHWEGPYDRKRNRRDDNAHGGHKPYNAQGKQGSYKGKYQNRSNANTRNVSHTQRRNKRQD